MNRATYHPQNSITSLFSRGYAGSNFEEVPFRDIPQWPAGALTASIGDLSNFVSMLLNNGRFKDRQLLSTASVKRMETPETSLQAQAGIK
jgi:CubicO group peptidase (beta-lactamase class C family)